MPLILWNKHAITAIANSLGKLYFWDEDSFGKLDKSMAWILVEVDFHGCLLVELELHWGPYSFRIGIDYWGLPFRCLMCHITSHLLGSCLSKA